MSSRMLGAASDRYALSKNIVKQESPDPSSHYSDESYLPSTLAFSENTSAQTSTENLSKTLSDDDDISNYCLFSCGSPSNTSLLDNERNVQLEIARLDKSSKAYTTTADVFKNEDEIPEEEWPSEIFPGYGSEESELWDDTTQVDTL